jgi:hypothetical protein
VGKGTLCRILNGHLSGLSQRWSSALRELLHHRGCPLGGAPNRWPPNVQGVTHDCAGSPRSDTRSTMCTDQVLGVAGRRAPHGTHTGAVSWMTGWVTHTFGSGSSSSSMGLMLSLEFSPSLSPLLPQSGSPPPVRVPRSVQGCASG